MTLAPSPADRLASATRRGAVLFWAVASLGLGGCVVSQPAIPESSPPSRDVLVEPAAKQLANDGPERKVQVAEEAGQSRSPTTQLATPTTQLATPTTQSATPIPATDAAPVTQTSAHAPGSPSPAPAASRTPPFANQPYASRDDVRSFAQAVAASRALDVDQVMRQLVQAKYVPMVAKLMMPPPLGSVKDWSAYRARFVEPKRIEAGLAFWRANEAWLAQAEARWGVPAAIVVGVVGVETFYGRITGNFRVIDALATLSFDFPTGRRDRTPFFRAQLEEFLHWCDRENIDPQSVLGSYAGAMGLPQFMPTSIARWAVDFDEDGRVDLMSSTADVVGSVAHYMAAHGWQRDVPAYYRVTAPSNADQRAKMLEPDIVPTFTAAQMQAQGAVLPETGARAHPGRMALIELHNGLKAGPTYVAGTENFYVVTRYNWSSYYAMAVIDLGSAIASAKVKPASALSPAAAEQPLKRQKHNRIVARAR